MVKYLEDYQIDLKKSTTESVGNVVLRESNCKYFPAKNATVIPFRLQAAVFSNK